MKNYDIIEVKTFDKNNMGNTKFNDLMRNEHFEFHPNDPYSENKLNDKQKEDFKSIVQPLISKSWFIKKNDEIIGYAMLFSNNSEFPQNVFDEDMGLFKLYILKKYRCKKAGTILYAKIISEGKNINL